MRVLKYETEVEARVLPFYEQVFGSVFGEEVAFGFDYDSVREYEVRGVMAVWRRVAYSAGFVGRLYARFFELLLDEFFKAGAVCPGFVAEGGAGVY